MDLIPDSEDTKSCLACSSRAYSRGDPDANGPLARHNQYQPRQQDAEVHKIQTHMQCLRGVSQISKFGTRDREGTGGRKCTHTVYNPGLDYTNHCYHANIYRHTLTRVLTGHCATMAGFRQLIAVSPAGIMAIAWQRGFCMQAMQRCRC